MKTPLAAPMRFVRGLLAPLIVLLGSALHAQTAGQIDGVVTDALSKSFLPGAQVQLSRSGFAAVSRGDGSFSINDVPAGDYTLTVSYVGYAPQTLPVRVAPGGTATVRASLSSEIVQLAAFQVEGAAAGQARAINEQAATTGNVDIVASDAIGNFPDQNAAQALQRLSGVSVQQLFGQATTVSIRGAGSDMNTTTLDGVTMMSDAAIFGQAGGSSANGRSVSLSDFPAQILSSVTVIKTVTPDLDANAIGGIVQLKTKSPFDFDGPVIDVNAGLQYSSESQKFAPLYGLTVVEQFGRNRDWGLAIAASDQRRKGLEEQIEVKSEGVESYTVAGATDTGYTMLQPELGNYDYDEHRTAASVNLEKKFGDATRLYVHFTRTVWIQKSGRPSLDLIDSTAASALSASYPVQESGGVFDEYTMTGVTVQRSTNPRTVSDASTNLIVGGETRLGDLKLDGSFAYNDGYGEVSARGSQWQATSKATVTYNYANPFYPSYTVVGGPNIDDPSQFTLSQFKANETLQNTDQYTGMADAERPFDIGDSQLIVKTGVNLRWSDLDNSKLAPTYTPNSTMVMSSAPGGLVGDSNSDFLSHYDLGPSVNPFGFSNWAFQNLGLFTLNAAKTLSTDLGGDDSIAEDVYAGYLMGTWKLGGFTAIAGARYEGTEDHSEGHQIPPTASALASAYPLTYYDDSYRDFMPGVLLRYDVTKRLVVRASWTNTIARPDTTYLAPTQDVDFQPNPTLANPDTVTGGNPELKATTSANWDGSVDYYFPGIGLVTAGVFYKAVDDPVYQSVYPGTYQGEPALFTSYQNASSAWVRGWEFEYQENLSFLPGLLDSLGVYANLTLVNSSVHVPSSPGEEYPFLNQAGKVANLGLSYQRGPVYARLAYNWTGSYLFSIDSPTLAEYEAPFHTLDVLATYSLGRHWTIKFTGNNLTGFPTRSYFNNPGLLDVLAQDGRFFTLGVNWEY